MRYTLTVPEIHYAQLVGILEASKDERAAYLICGIAETENEARLLVREVIAVDKADILESSPVHLKIAPRSFLRAMKRANQQRAAFVFVHSHPNGLGEFSPQDDLE